MLIPFIDEVKREGMQEWDAVVLIPFIDEVGRREGRGGKNGRLWCSSPSLMRWGGGKGKQEYEGVVLIPFIDEVGRREGRGSRDGRSLLCDPLH